MDRSLRRSKITEDRISALPDEILHIVLSRLPTKSQIETSRLSRRWMNLWSFNPVLHLFDDGTGHKGHYDRPKLLYSLFRFVLHRYQAQHLLEFEADIRDISDDLAENLIDFATFGSLHRFSITTHLDYPHRLIGRPLAQYMKRTLSSLRVIELGSVFLADCSDLLLACPLLERLRLVRLKGLDSLKINSPKLEILEVECGTECTLESLVIVSAPRLLRLVSIRKALHYGDILPNLNSVVSIEDDVPHLLGISLRRDPQLIEDDLPHLLGMSIGQCPQHSPNYLLPVIPSIAHVRVLAIDLYLLLDMVHKYIKGRSQPNLFGGLKELHLHGSWIDDFVLEALCVFLGQEPPSIEKVCLQFGDGYRFPDLSEDHCQYRSTIMEYHEYIGRVYESHNEKPCYKSLDQCTSMTRLRIIRMIGFMGTRNEMRLVDFLLRSATNLESLLLFLGGSDWPRNLIERLSWCNRASPGARIMLAGGEEDIETLCCHPNSNHLFNCVEEVEDYESGCICTWHSVSRLPLYANMKTVYVQKIEGKLKMARRITGTVKLFYDTKGFGFITPDDGSKDIFVDHQSLVEGEVVEFEIFCGNDGHTKAVNVTGPGGMNVKGSTWGPNGRDSWHRGQDASGYDSSWNNHVGGVGMYGNYWGRYNGGGGPVDFGYGRGGGGGNGNGWVGYGGVAYYGGGEGGGRGSTIDGMKFWNG